MGAPGRDELIEMERRAWGAGCMAEGHTEDQSRERALFGHPIGLVNLFGVEFWERFSFYGDADDPRLLHGAPNG
ncbi:hypothetical protein EAH80_15405 [Mycobacterium hodleri]|uniref:Uncharacterized protein n=1 Tax=Mycolicibacterium hodleri TaxID=49897 RepID=A0A502EAV0_9MYCO|nr:hypothetical protein EAH80_15405 [Mycolicibacterium hodleri]